MVDVQVASAWSSANASTPTLTYDGSGNVNNAWRFESGNAREYRCGSRDVYLAFFGPIAFNMANQANDRH